MVFPTTTMVVPLPEELGIIKNVNAIVKLKDKEFHIPCEHVTRYHSSCISTWPKIFDQNAEIIPISYSIEDNNEPNTSIFEGTYTFYDETYLEGTLYFVFDYCKDNQWFKNNYTDIVHFKEDKENFYDLLDMLNKK